MALNTMRIGSVEASLASCDAGYQSDLERDELAERQADAAAALQELSASVGAMKNADSEQQVEQSYLEGNEWMDLYRKDVVKRCDQLHQD